MMRLSLFFLGGFLFYDLEAGGDSRGSDSRCGGPCVMGFDGDCCDSSCPSDSTGAVRVFRSWGGHRSSRVSLLDGHMCAFSHLRAMAHGRCADVQAFGWLNRLSENLVVRQRTSLAGSGVLSLRPRYRRAYALDKTPSRGSAACCGNERQRPDFGGVSVIVCSSASRGWHARAGAADVRAGHYLGGRYGGLFRRASRRQTCFVATPESEENVGGDGGEFPRLNNCRSYFCALHHCAAPAFSCDGCCRQRGGASWRPPRIGVQAQRGDEGFRQHSAGAWRRP